MPTPEEAPTAALLEKILPQMLNLAAESGWTEQNLQKALMAAEIDPASVSPFLPHGAQSLLVAWLETSVQKVSSGLSELDLETMRIRDKVTNGVRIWFDALSAHHGASVKALDWISARPTGPLPVTEFIWSVADAIWTGIGDQSTGFTYFSKRTTLSGVLVSTLAVWRQGEDADWTSFLDRRIEDVMAFEKFKAGFKLPLPL